MVSKRSSNHYTTGLMCCWWLLSPCAQWRGCPLRFESFVEIRTNIFTHLLHHQSSHGWSQTCNRYEICGRLHSSSEELKRQAEFLSVIMQVCPRPDFPPIKQFTYRNYHLSSRGKSGRGHTCRMSERNSASLFSSSEKQKLAIDPVKKRPIYLLTYIRVSIQNQKH